MSIAARLWNKTFIVAAENVSHYKSEGFNEETLKKKHIHYFQYSSHVRTSNNKQVI